MRGGWVALGFCAASVVAAAAGLPPVTVWVPAQDASLSEGAVVVDAPPDEIRNTLRNVTLWPAVFSDIRWVRVESTNNGAAVVRFHSQFLGFPHTMKVAWQDETHARFDLLENHLGSQIWGDFRMNRDEKGGTRVVARLRSQITGGLGGLPPLPLEQDRRNAKLRQDLEDLATWFTIRRPPR